MSVLIRESEEHPSRVGEGGLEAPSLVEPIDVSHEVDVRIARCFAGDIFH